MSSAPPSLIASAVNTVAAPPRAMISRRSHSKSSRHWSVSGSTYTELRVGTAPSCCRRRHVLTRAFESRVGSWCARSSQRGAVNTDDRNRYYMQRYVYYSPEDERPMTGGSLDGDHLQQPAVIAVQLPRDVAVRSRCIKG